MSVPTILRPLLQFIAVALALSATAGMGRTPGPAAMVSGVATADAATSLAPSPNATAPKDKVYNSTTHAARRKAHLHDAKAARILNLPGFGQVTVYAPPGAARGLALFASGDGGWNLGVWDMAQQAAQLGYWVAGFSTPAFLRTLDHADAACSDAAGALAELGRRVREAMHISAHYRPVLIGYSSGATVAYAALAQAGDARFSGAMTLGFCPDLVYHKPFCEDAGLTADRQRKPPYGYVFNTVPSVQAPWIVLQGDIDKICNPPATRAFVDKVKNAKVINLPHVGHGYGMPRHWMPQYIQGLIELRDGDAASATHVARAED